MSACREARQTSGSEREGSNLRRLVPETSAWPLGYAPLNEGLIGLVPASLNAPRFPSGFFSLTGELSAQPPSSAPNSDRTSTFRSSDGRADQLRHRGKLAGYGSPPTFVCYSFFKERLAVANLWVLGELNPASSIKSRVLRQQSLGPDQQLIADALRASKTEGALRATGRSRTRSGQLKRLVPRPFGRR